MKHIKFPLQFCKPLRTQFLFIILISISFLAVAQPTNKNDSLALVDLYHSTNGDEWNMNTNWLKKDVSQWYGIIIKDGRVVEIRLDENNLEGRLHASIGMLDSLKFLLLSRNEITGEIPKEIGNLETLGSIWLNKNHLDGALPAEISGLKKLTALNLSHNNLTEPIPPEIGEIDDLWLLYLDNNNLSNAIPKELFQLKRLLHLTLNNNNLSGFVPEEVGDLKELTLLHLSGNQLEGCVPSSLKELRNLRFLNLSRNEFDCLPDLTGMTKPEAYFDINNNFLTFKDLEPNRLLIDSYAPQKIKILSDTNIYDSEEFLNISQNVGGSVTTYKWSKDESDFILLTANKNRIYLKKDSLVFKELNIGDAGVYQLTATNYLLPDLIFKSPTYNVVVSAINLTNTISLLEDDTLSNTLNLNTIIGFPNGFDWKYSVSTNSTQFIAEELDKDKIRFVSEENFNGETELYINIQSPSIEDFTDTLKIDVIPVNDPPQIGEIEDQSIDGELETLKTIELEVSDIDNSLDELTITAKAENHTMLPSDSIRIELSDDDFQLILAPYLLRTDSSRIEVIVSDSEQTDTLAFTFIVASPKILSLLDKSNNYSTIIYPNPTESDFWIRSKTKFNEIELIYEDGRRIEFIKDLNTYEYRFELGELPSGTYYLRIDRSSVKKLIIL